MNFLPPLSAKTQQAGKIYTSSALKHSVSVLFRIDFKKSAIRLFH